MAAVTPFRVLCGAGMCAIFSSTLAKSPVLPLYAAYLHATPADIGFIAAASTVTGIVVSAPAGGLSDLWGRRRVILLAMAVFALAPFLYLGVNNVASLVAVRVFHGLATAIFGPVALALVADLYSRERGEKMGWYSSSTLAGRSAAPLVGGALLGAFTLASPAGFRAVYWACGAAGVVALLLALRLPTPAPATAAPRRAAFRQGLGEVLSHRGILFTSSAEAVQFLAYGAMEAFLPLYARSLGLDAYQIGLLLGLQVLVVALTKPIMGRLADRRGRRQQIVIGLLVGATGLALLPLARSFWALLPISLGFGLTVATVTSATAALVADLARARSHGMALGTMSAIMDVGQALGPVVTGLLITAWGYGIGFGAVAAALALVGLAFPLVVRPEPAEA